jgi:hypothetical protein
MLSSIAGISGSGFSVDEGFSEVEKAIAILRQLISESYRAPELKNESCLEPLRARPEYQLLMLDVDSPATLRPLIELDPSGACRTRVAFSRTVLSPF